MAEKTSSKSLLHGWLADHGLDCATFLPEVWQMLRNNLAVLKDLSGFTQEEIARKIHGTSKDKKVSGSKRVMVAHTLLESNDIEQLEQIARACGFDPLLLVMPNLRECVSTLANSLTSEIQFETSIFRAMRKCEKCNHLNRDPNARYCSQCGTRIENKEERHA